MPLSAIELDDATWEGVSLEREIEWEANIQDLLEPGHAHVDPQIDTLWIETDEQRYRIVGRRGPGEEGEEGAPGEEVAVAEIPHHVLRDGIHEYVDTVRQIALSQQEGGGVARLEALDMAKKVVHDKMARKVKRHARPLGLDHDTARRLFTLLLSIRVDTTRLYGVHGHRRIR